MRTPSEVMYEEADDSLRGERDMYRSVAPVSGSGITCDTKNKHFQFPFLDKKVKVIKQ